MNFCSHCGNPVSQRIPQDDNRLRFVCDNCNTIHYENPRIVVGCLPEWEGQVLLCRRAIEPRLGYWTLPAGFMENGETTAEGALRETWEEALARVREERLYRLFNLPQINQVYMFFIGTLEDKKFGVGLESSEVRLFAESEIPWKELAFPVMAQTLREYFEDSKKGEFTVRISDITWPSKRKPASR